MGKLKEICKWIYAKVHCFDIDFHSVRFSSFRLISRLDKESRIVRSVCGSARLGRHVRISDAFLYGDKLRIGNYVSINGPGTIINSLADGISIGDFSSIGPNVSIVDFNHDMDYFTTSFIVKSTNCKNDQPFVSKGPVTIEEDVWIGSNVVIVSGVTVGRGAIIAAGSVITNDVESYMIVAGSPARVLRERFSRERRISLDDSLWWHKNIHELGKMI